MSVITRLMNGSPVGAVGAKLMNDSPAASAKEDRARIETGRTARAGELAAAHAALGVLKEERQSRIEADLPIDEVRSKILAAQFDLKRLTSRCAEEERLADEETAAFQKKGHRLRVEALDQSEAASREELGRLDEEIIKTLIVASVLFGKRLKLEHDLFGTCARTQHLTGLPKGMGALDWTETALTAEFLRVHREEVSRPRPFAELGWGPFTLSIPVLTPDRVTAALVADDEASASA